MCSRKDCEEPLKPLSEFRNYKNAPDKKDPICKSCKKRLWNDYKKRNSEKVQEYQKQYVHHIKSVTQEPIYTNDTDNCITVCKTCHINIHQQDGCTFTELRCKN